jgi:hypothetical protein
MPVEGINGILNVESAALHAPQVGVANTNPQHILSVGSNLYVSGDSPDVLTVDGNVVCEGVKVGLIEIIPSYDLEAVANVGNSTSNTIQFTNPDTGIVTTGNVTVGKDLNVTGNLNVLGTTTTIDTENLRVQDPIIELGKDNAGTGDLGLIMTRPSGSSNVAIIFDENADTLEIGYTDNDASATDITMVSTPLSVNINGDLSVTSNLEVGTANLFVDTVNSRVGIGTNDPVSGLTVFRDIESSNSFITERVLFKETWPNGLNSLVGDLGTWVITNLDQQVNPGVETTPDGYGIVAFRGDDAANGEFVSPAFDLSDYAIVDGVLQDNDKRKTTTRVFMKFWLGTRQLDVDGEVLQVQFSPDNGTTWYTVATSQDRATVDRFTMVSADLSPYILSTGTPPQAKIRFYMPWLAQNGDYMRIGRIWIHESDVPTNLGGMWLGAGGNIGIGTTNPQVDLEIENVNGSPELRFTDPFSGGGAPWDARSNVLGEISWYSRDSQFTNSYGKVASITSKHFDDGFPDGALCFTTSTNGVLNEDAMVIDQTGNVGIGTTDPTDLLDVHYPNPSYGSLAGTEEGSLTVSAGAEHSNAAVYFRTPFDAAAPAKRAIFSDGGGYSGGASGGLHFCLESTNDNITKVDLTDSKMTILQNGKVGIGTTNPSKTLDIGFADYGYPGIRFTHTDPDGIDRLSSGYEGFFTGIEAVIERYADKNVRYSGSNVPEVTHRINLGYSDSYRDNSGFYPEFHEMHFEVMNKVNQGDSTATLDRIMTLRGNGNVGIGVTDPTYAKLHVIGSTSYNITARYYNVAGDNGTSTSNRDLSGYFGSHLACAELQVFSDRRIKTEIEDIDDGSALELFRQIQPKTYKYLDKVERGNERVYGFVAQEIKDLMPDAVDVSSGKIPNIYEVANVSNSNVITFTHFNTSNLESNSNIIEVQTVHGESHSLNITEVVDEHTIRVNEDLSEWIGSVDESGNVATGNELFVYGQEVNDFHHLKKSAIWTVTTAALQEVDRQQQADKVRISELHTELQTLKARLNALENAS